MCGIAGIVGIDSERATPALDAMLRAIAHRGPDAHQTSFVDVGADHPPIALAHARLAIIDLSADGVQPMTDDERELTIVFNGEIYNYRELRSELQGRGHRFRTATDTEVILRAHREWGNGAIERLRGMFAYALVDARSKRVLFVRDRLGIKPLYFARARGGLLFASEVRSILASGFVDANIDRAALESFFAQGMVCGMQSILAGISMLAPGELVLCDASGKELERQAYWRLDDVGSTTATRDEAIAELGAELRESVAGHLLSDVPLGLFLSSGIDSGALTTLAVENGGARVKTLGIGFDERAFDESDEAAKAAAALGTEHTTIRLAGADMLAEIDHVFDAMDQPTVDGFNTFFVSRAARRSGLTVALSGLGGDELFGGYASFDDVPRAAKVSQLLRPLRPLASTLAGFVPPRDRRLVKIRELARRTPSFAEVYLLRRELLLRSERRVLFELAPESDELTGVPRSVLSTLERAAATHDRNAVSRLEIGSYMRDMLLRDSDVFSMSVGLELRVPLLDHRVVELAASYPSEWKKKKDGRLKPLLIDAVGERLPLATNRTKKRGFTFPWSAWLRGPLRARSEEILRDKSVWRAIGIRESAPVALLERFWKGDPTVGGLEILSLWVIAEYTRRRWASA